MSSDLYFGKKELEHDLKKNSRIYLDLIDNLRNLKINNIRLVEYYLSEQDNVANEKWIELGYIHENIRIYDHLYKLLNEETYILLISSIHNLGILIKRVEILELKLLNLESDDENQFKKPETILNTKIIDITEYIKTLKTINVINFFEDLIMSTEIKKKKYGWKHNFNTIYEALGGEFEE